MTGVRREQAVVDAATVSALVAGDGPPIVLLHGIPTGAELWRQVFAPLVDGGFRVLAPDLPGYGRTRLPASGDHSLAGAAELLARWLGVQDLPPVWVVGHDAGGAVAQILAVDHPDRVCRLTLVNSMADGSWPAPRARFARLAARLGLYRAAAACRLVPNGYLRHQVHRGFADPASAATVDGNTVFWDTKFTDKDGRRAFERHLAALDAADTGRVLPGLRRLPIPCQLVWGMDDVFQPWDVAGRRLQELLPAAAATLLDGCGHFVPLECADGLAAGLLRWHAGDPRMTPARPTEPSPDA